MRRPWSGQFQLCYFGPRPLVADDSVRSKSTTLACLRIGYTITPNLRLALRQVGVELLVPAGLGVGPVRLDRRISARRVCPGHRWP